MYEYKLGILDLLVRTKKNASFAKNLDQLMPKVCEKSKKRTSWDFYKWTVVEKKAVSSARTMIVIFHSTHHAAASIVNIQV